jgi:hypothetical protein
MRQDSTPTRTTVIATRAPLVVQRLAELAAEEMGVSVSRWLWEAARDSALRQLSESARSSARPEDQVSVQESLV